MNYIINTPEGCKIVSKDKISVFNKPNLSIVKEMLISNLSSYEAYVKAVKIKVGLKSLIPVYISDSIILVPTSRVRDYENIWINFEEIKKFGKNEIIFNDDSRLNVQPKLLKQIEKVRILKKYIELIK